MDAWRWDRSWKRSIVTDESFLKHHLIPYFGEMMLADITGEEVERFKKTRKRISKNTINL